MTRIKICGLTREIDVERVNFARPDYAGFVFAPTSRRYVAYDRAAELRRLLDRDIVAVGVFVDAPVDEVASLLVDGVIEIAQLHGRESAEYVSELRARVGAPIIQAFQIGGRKDVEFAMRSTADYLLLDSGAGSGRVFDWFLLNGVDRPYFLAGGLNPDNVAEAIQRFHPFAVDMSGGVEVNGRKDLSKILRVVSEVRSEDNLRVF